MRLVTCSVLFLGVGTALTQAASLEPKEASDTVTIQADNQVGGSCGGNLIKFDRLVVKSGGTVEPFTLPPQKVLVVTSFDWTASGGVGLANRSRTAWLFRFKGGGVNGPSAQSSALADSNGRVGASEVFPTGIVLENPGALCLQMDTQAYGEAIIGVVNGFLAPDK
jgi:hypothetical protein